MALKLIMSGGGSGGHVNPALAIAKYFVERNRDVKTEVLFVGTKAGLESVLVPKEGFEIKFVNVRGIKRKLTPSNIYSLILSVTSRWEVRRIIKEFQPDLAIGTGGFAAWPTLKVAAGMGIPTMIHESNAFPGVTTKLLAPHAGRVLLTFDECKKYLRRTDNCVVTGNPIKEEFYHADRAAARRKLNLAGDELFILSYGGSQGAYYLSLEMLQAMAELTGPAGVRHIHITGPKEFGQMTRKFGELGLSEYPNLQLLDYCYEMPQYMAAADLVICRAGSMTLSELAALGQASVLVPSPYVAENHQFRNAAVLRDAGAAKIVEEKQFAGGAMRAALRELMADRPELAAMGERIRRFSVGDPLGLIYEQAVGLLGNKGKIH